jgi:hypothetical protein
VLTVGIYSGFHQSGPWYTARHLAGELERRGVQVRLRDLRGEEFAAASTVVARFRERATGGEPIDGTGLTRREVRAGLLEALTPAVRRLGAGVDVHVATHPFAGWLLAEVVGQESPVHLVHTDFTPYPVFESAGYAACYGPRLWRCERRGLVQCGIPVRNDRRRDGEVDRDVDFVFVGGADGFVPFEPVTDFLEQLGGRAVVVCGRNGELATKLRRRYARTVVRGEVDDLPALLARAAVTITKASGVTVTEAFWAGSSVVLSPPAVRWEAEAGAILAGQGCVSHLPSLSDVELASVSAILGATDLLANQRRVAALVHCGASASEAVVEGVLRWPQSPAPPPGGSDSGDEQPFDALRNR